MLLCSVFTTAASVVVGGPRETAVGGAAAVVAFAGGFWLPAQRSGESGKTHTGGQNTDIAAKTRRT